MGYKLTEDFSKFRAVAKEKLQQIGAEIAFGVESLSPFQPNLDVAIQ